MAASTLCVELTIVSIFLISGNPTTLSLKMWTYSSTLHVCINGLCEGLTRQIYRVMVETLELRTEMEFYWSNIGEIPNRTINTFQVKLPGGSSFKGQEDMRGIWKTTVYYFWIGEDEALMFLYLGKDAFDRQCGMLKNYYSVMSKTFPKFLDALDNGINNRYSQYALVKIQQENCKDEPFWCMANILENVKELDIRNPYIERKYSYLFNACQDVLYEKKKNKLSNWDIIKTNIIAFAKGCIGTYRINESFDKIEKIISTYYQGII